MPGFEIELEKIRHTYQTNLNKMKEEVRIAVGKQSVLMQTVSVMADSIARRNIMIEELYRHIDDHDELSPNLEVVQRAKELILP